MRLIISTILLLNLISCERDVIGVNDTEVNLQFTDKEILPLAVGNSWSYDANQYDENGVVVNTFKFKKEITEIAHFEGETWYRLLTTEFPHEAIFYQFRIDGLYSRLPNYFGDHIFHKYIYRGEVGDASEYNFRDFEKNINTHNTTEISSDEAHITINGISYSCIEYTTTKRINGQTSQIVEYFSPGIGLIRKLYYDQNGLLSREDLLLNYNIISDT